MSCSVSSQPESLRARRLGPGGRQQPLGSQDEFLDVVYWFRQIIAVVLGVIWGVAPLKGFLGIAIFCIINAGVLYVYFSSFQQVDEEEYGGMWELTKEGFMTSFALFLVVWIIFYTALHYD
ncbi:uncharacterized protein RAB5IF isoform X2 [Electrophorus electricus]|uniref:uncharacterized protein RAB5IF isoform X2 n=1 Tax=Electrophorus electricus TaxID=8005 RepID=UPI0015CFE024|nr:uncharacterized protein RAB5IF isoform X2 [Electrophorus electricus]